MTVDLKAAFDAFHEVRELDERGRCARLAAIREESRELAELVDRMLRDDDRARGLAIDHPLGFVSPDLSGETPAPERVGPYAIVRELGAGTFGRVYLAERGEPFRQVVALKALHSFHGSERTLRRFRREMSALSEMDDPGVARLLDAGVGADGTPYLATEYIEGERIDVYCRGLAAMDRLELVAQVCDAVHHAHQRSIVHRDIKPSNVLVGGVGGGARSRVIDFGIAKLLEPGPEDGTVEAVLVGTPGFMSPEQRAGEAVDARTDVFGLGLLLALVLTGTKREDWAEDDAPDGVVRRLYEGPRRADLAFVAARATRVDREERYPSAAHMGEELRRVAAGLPLLDGPSGPWRSAWLHAARRPVSAGAAVVLIALALVLGIGLAATNRQLAAAVHENQTVSQRLTVAVDGQAELIAEATRVVAVQLDVVIGTTESRAALIDDLLAQAQALDGAGIGDRSIRLSIAQLLGAKGDLAQSGGRAGEALAIRGEVVAMADALAAAEPFDADRARWHAEAVIKLGDSHKATGDLPGAIALYGRAMAMQEAALERFPGEAVGLLDDLCWSVERLTDLRYQTDASDPGYREGVRRRHGLATRLVSLDPGRTLSLYCLADAELDMQDIAEAAGDLERADGHVDRALGLSRRLVETEPDRLHYNALLALALRYRCMSEARAGRFGEAQRFADEALALGGSVMERDPSRLEATVIWLGAVQNAVKLARWRQDGQLHAEWVGRFRRELEAASARHALPERFWEALEAEERDPVPAQR